MYIFLEVAVIVILQLVTADLKQVHDIFRYVCEFAFLDCIERFEVVVNVFQTRFAKTSYTVYQLTGEVIALIVIKSLFENGIVVQAAHGERSGTLHLFYQLLLELHGTHCTTQSAQVFVQEGGNRTFKIIFGEFQYSAEFLTGMLAQ